MVKVTKLRDDNTARSHSKLLMELVLCAAISKPGRRGKNEDAYVLDPDSSFFAVADGIGGAQYGDIMSKVACNSARDGWARAGRKGLTGGERMSEAIAYADDACSSVSEWLGGGPSGTTIVAAACEGDSIYLASVGDSAAFGVRENGLSRLTDLGRRSSTSRVLSSALGYRLRPQPRVRTVRRSDVDALLLCTDGVWDSARREDLHAVFREGSGRAEDAASAVVELADGADDATALVLMTAER